ncbi:MAG: BrnT family toxin [Acidobacteria bacterium]|nr:BrnT family toxin [Acidobacteriota bacterium]
MRFEWDERKSAANLKKHGVTFEEAKTVFADDLNREARFGYRLQATGFRLRDPACAFRPANAGSS